MRERLFDADLNAGHVGQAFTNVGQHRFARAVGGFHRGDELGDVDAFGMFIQFGSSGSARHRDHLRHGAD